MELKLSLPPALAFQISILIAPIWNWNIVKLLNTLKALTILIAPIWNWNMLIWITISNCIIILIAPIWNWNRSAGSQGGLCSLDFNRTNMELKPFFVCLVKPYNWVWAACFLFLVKVRFIAVSIDRSALTLLRNVREVPSEL